MATITEDYVSFEVAKLLKKKGFTQEYDRYHSMVYNEEDYEDEYEVQRMIVKTRIVKAGTLSSYPVGVPEPKCYCPTLQMAMKWLREVHDIDIFPWKIGKGIYSCAIFNSNTGQDLSSDKDFPSEKYEEAAEAAIRYCLENLI